MFHILVSIQQLIIISGSHIIILQLETKTKI